MASTIETVTEYTTQNGTTIAIVKGGVSNFYQRQFVESKFKTKVLAYHTLNNGQIMAEVRTPGVWDRNFYGPTLLPVGMVARKP